MTKTLFRLAEIADGGSTGRHTHPGIETGYVLEGTTLLAIDGEAPRTLRAGDSYSIAAK
jgi:quercetin dioxygenase-like cupin family protein